jgi:hypothetical protein
MAICFTPVRLISAARSDGQCCNRPSVIACRLVVLGVVTCAVRNFGRAIFTDFNFRGLPMLLFTGKFSENGNQTRQRRT